jgi:hypothetical protein
MCCFATKLEVATRLQIEVRAGSRQLSHPRRPFLDEHLDSLCVTQSRSRSESVLTMELG